MQIIDTDLTECFNSMSKVEKHIKSAIKQLPLMVGKTIGGIMAAIGFPGAIFILVRRPHHTSEILAFCLAGILGIIMFVLCSKSLRRIPQNNGIPVTSKEKARESAAAWLILLVFAAIFILVTQLSQERKAGNIL
jgi:Na+/melibiose symporter-like transporter